MPSGGYLAVSYVSSDGGLLTVPYQVAERPDSLPRVDAIVNTADPPRELRAGWRATISGEGLADVTSVSIDERAVNVAKQSDTAIEFEIPPNLRGLTPQKAYTGDVLLWKGEDLAWRVRVQIYAPISP